MRCSLNSDTTTTSACWPLGLGLPSHLIVRSLTPFSAPNHSIADLLTFPLLISIARGTLTQFTLTACHLGPINLAPGMYGSSHCVVVCRSVASWPFSTKNLIMFVLSFARQTRKSFNAAPASFSTFLMPYVITYLAASVVSTFSTALLPTRLTSITSWPWGSLFGFSTLVIHESDVLDSVPLWLAAIDAHDCVGGGSVKKTFSCA